MVPGCSSMTRSRGSHLHLGGDRDLRRWVGGRDCKIAACHRHAVLEARFLRPNMGQRRCRRTAPSPSGSGTSALRPIAGGSVGSASCGAVEALARLLAVELAPIRVNTIVPGLVDTPLIDKLFGDRREALIASAAAHLPVKRVGRPQDIVDGVLFLMKKGFVSGITLTIVGGWLAAGLVHASDANAHP
jgi:NAD(P)-dependent dehydrogenase (short-subunit alcohol dehydrogenase family)